MSDIVERLRQGRYRKMWHEAADEIERLQFEYESADLSAKRLGAKWKEATDETERLREQITDLIAEKIVLVEEAERLKREQNILAGWLIKRDAEIERLRAENERFREQLKWINS